MFAWQRDKRVNTTTNWYTVFMTLYNLLTRIFSALYFKFLLLRKKKKDNRRISSFLSISVERRLQNCTAAQTTQKPTVAEKKTAELYCSTKYSKTHSGREKDRKNVLQHKTLQNPQWQRKRPQNCTAAQNTPKPTVAEKKTAEMYCSTKHSKTRSGREKDRRTVLQHKILQNPQWQRKRLQNCTAAQNTPKLTVAEKKTAELYCSTKYSKTHRGRETDRRTVLQHKTLQIPQLQR